MEEVTFKPRPKTMRKSQPCEEWVKNAVRNLQAEGACVLRLGGGGKSLEDVRTERRQGRRRIE